MFYEFHFRKQRTPLINPLWTCLGRCCLNQSWRKGILVLRNWINFAFGRSSPRKIAASHEIFILLGIQETRFHFKTFAWLSLQRNSLNQIKASKENVAKSFKHVRLLGEKLWKSTKSLLNLIFVFEIYSVRSKLVCIFHDYLNWSEQ